jgi:hypothetical protein
MAKVDAGLRKCIIGHTPQIHWQAIETGSTGRGIPDLNGCFRSFEIWIECKKADHWAVEVQPEQVGWAERRVRAGGTVFCAVRRLPNDELWLLRHEALRKLREPKTGLRDLSPSLILGRWSGGPRQWAWAAFLTQVFPAIPAAIWGKGVVNPVGR